MNDMTGPGIGNSSAPPARLVPVGAQVPATPSLGYDPLGYGAPPPDAGEGLRETILEYVRIFYRRRWLILILTLTVLVIGSVRTLMQTPLYTAVTRIQIDPTAPKVVETGATQAADFMDYEALRTQYEVLKSRSIAERAASALKLGRDPTFGAPTSTSLLGYVRALISPSPKAATVNERAAEARAAGVILGNRDIRPVTGSRLVDIAYSDPNPARAQRVSVALAEAYISANIDKRFKSNEYAKTFLEDQSKQLQLRLEDSERILVEFSEKNEIIVLSEKSSIAENNLSAASGALSNLIAQRIQTEQTWKQVESTKSLELPQFLGNAVIQGLRASRNALQSEYQDKLQTFKPAYPSMVELQSKINEIDRQIAAEVRAIKASLKGAYEGAVRQETETRNEVERLKAEALDLQKRLIQYNILKREVDTNRSLYNGLLQRFKEVEVAGGVGTNNIYIVDRAEVPGGPSSPNVRRSILLSLMLGLGLGFGAAYLSGDPR